MPRGGTTESSGNQPAPSPLPTKLQERILLSGGLDFDSTDLLQAWKCWREEITLYMDLVTVGKDGKTKVNLFHYIIESKGQKTNETVHFE